MVVNVMSCRHAMGLAEQGVVDGAGGEVQKEDKVKQQLAELTSHDIQLKVSPYHVDLPEI